VNSERYRAKAVAELSQILPIFGLPSKREIKKFSRSLEITNRGLCALILASADLGFNHERVSREWVPPHLDVTDDVVNKIQKSTDAERLPIFRKIFPIFDERKLFTGHLFYRLGEWHLFFFDQRDRDRKQNQWKHGSHIHFLNHIIRPEMSLSNIVDELNSERPRIGSEIHIRYREISEEELRSE
jgi:hypothetical protein